MKAEQPGDIWRRKDRGRRGHTLRAGAAGVKRGGLTHTSAEALLENPNMGKISLKDVHETSVAPEARGGPADAI